ncbi:hypothetical protein BJ166DRAFT_496424 [Pestalotiopsis sp. NC0098]|nr:hypothetical protein BJ166DRAFT_496424 [Pestalotiopsis sp. NC0098]
MTSGCQQPHRRSDLLRRKVAYIESIYSESPDKLRCNTMSFDLQSIAQAALDMASLPDADQKTRNSEEKSRDLGNGGLPTGSYKSPTVSDEEDGNDHLPSQHMIPGLEGSVPGHNEAGTPPTQAETSEAPTSQAPEEVEDSNKPGAVAVVDFAATEETPVPQSQDNSVDALFDVYDDYESQLDESPNQSGTSQAESSDELFVRQPSTEHEFNTDLNTNGGNSDDQTAPLPSSPAVSIAVESRAAGTQPELNEQSDNTTIHNRETIEEHEEDIQINAVVSQVSTLPNEEAQVGPQVESVSDDHDQASQEEIKGPIDQSNSDARQSSSQEPEGRSKVPIAHMELSFEENPDQDINQEIEPLTPPDQEQSQTGDIAHQEPIEASRPVSITESTEVVSQNDSQPSEGYVNEEAESQHSPLEVSSEPVTKQEEDKEKPVTPEYQSPQLKFESPPLEVKDEETYDSPEPPTQPEVGEKESPVPEVEAHQPVDASQTPEEAAPEQRQDETPKPRARKPLPTGPLLNRPQKAKPASRAPRKRKLGIYDYFYESDPENWPKKSRIARPQPDDKPKAKKSKKRSREEQEEEGHQAATASDASDDEALAVKKREPKKPRGTPKAAKEPKVATEKKKRGPKPGAKKPGPKKKKTEELSKPIVESDFDNDSEFVVEANIEDHSEEE